MNDNILTMLAIKWKNGANHKNKLLKLDKELK